ncbi:hypothetical protein WICPIJ_006753 [Wickerhamomyces pijperi]|uniref:Small-subunit processome Utp12 domain-containing protein n=1 Tax=Wickerhamomyces pijperi TaxID=599730 RepID=A0A9P8Q3P3_WICPI|nr:hypothetical protein WICPIJ_006753 [Wickerhamomyces pijperi]
MSSLIVSQFSQSGQHYTSVIQALDTHKVRTQSTESSSLVHAFPLDKGVKVTCLSWGQNANTSKSTSAVSTEDTVSIENQVVNICTSKGTILLYNPLADQIIATLTNPNHVPFVSFEFSRATNSGWSVDVNSNVIEWDLLLFKVKETYKFDTELQDVKIVRVVKYQGKTCLLLASQSIVLYDLGAKEVLRSFPGHISPIHTLIPFSSDGKKNDNTAATTHFITAAEGDRFVNVYSLDNSTAANVLVAQSNIKSCSYSNSNVSILSEDGIVELFTDILTKPTLSTAKTNSRRKGQQSKQSQHKIHLTREETSQPIAITSCVLLPAAASHADALKISWLESSEIPYFQTIQLAKLATETITISKAKPAVLATDHSLYGRDVAAPTHYNEGQTHVTSGDNLRHLDNKESLEDELEYDENDGPSMFEKLDALSKKGQQYQPQHQPQSTTTNKKKRSTQAIAGSLTTILTQSLRTNDHTLLETVLSTTDINVIRSTISRLDTSLSILLLERLAERIARHSNRQGQLNVWVKWVLVVHGAYLVNLTDGALAKGLSSLNSTLIKRAGTLPRLSELKSMIGVYYDLKELESGAGGDADYDMEQSEDDEEEEEDEEEVEYVEELDDAGLIDDGEEDYDMDEDIEDEEEGYIRTAASDSDDDEAVEKFASDGEYDQEEGFSDEEIGAAKGVEEDEEEEDLEQAQLMDKIKSLKAKQDKKKSKKM